MKTTTCTRKSLLIAKIEKMIEDHWATVRLALALRDAVEDGLLTELATRRQDAESEHKQLASEKAKLKWSRNGTTNPPKLTSPQVAGLTMRVIGNHSPLVC